MKKAIEKQVGGIHYKHMFYQPVELFARTQCTAFQANIWKYISRYEFKDGRQDLEKCIHYANLAIELECEKELSASEMEEVHIFCSANSSLSVSQKYVITLAALNRYDELIEICEGIMSNEYPDEPDRLRSVK